MGIAAYLTMGAAVATMKWVDLVAKVRAFTATMETVVLDHQQMRCLAQEEFEPNDARDHCMMLPPNPYEFRTRIWLWFIYWPSFTFLRPLTSIHKVVATVVWNVLCSLSKEMYESRDYK